MNILQTIHQTFLDAIGTLGLIEKDVARTISFDLNVDENKQQFGDISSNAAMVLAKILNKPPREIAQALVISFKHPHVAKIEIAGPGFLNIFLTQDAFNELLTDICIRGELFFKLDGTIARKKFNIEYISANPTGPLHLGHGRGGIIGDVLANVLEFLGHTVVREYYINNAGSQIAKLGACLKIRCLQAAGMEEQLPEDGYAGTYLVELAQQCLKEYGVAVLGESNDFFCAYAIQHMLDSIKETLINYGIQYDVWFSEKTLHEDGSVQKTLELLEKHGYLFQQDGALWFRSSAFGDDKDRVMRKESGEYTYVAADAAYLKNKAERGFDVLVMILGHDHHGYVERLQGLRKALGFDTLRLDTILYQLVKMKLEGEQVRMSKRAGTIVMLSDVINTVGPDVTRFFYLNKKADAQLDFDLDLALKKTDENPVYYVQYAYVRTHSMLQKASVHEEFRTIMLHDTAHLGQAERLLIKKIVSLRQLLQDIAGHYHTHLLTHYVLELATAFHRYYATHRVIDPANIPQTRSRLLLIKTLGETFEIVLRLLKVSQPTSM